MKKLKVLTALLAALVFVFAVGCDSSGDDVASSSGTSYTYESGTDGLVKDVYHVYTAAGLKEYHDVTLNDTTLSCTLHTCIDMSELEDFS